jgi:alpha-glucosidase (family GH31 glycosyl hydrolase)
MFGPDYLLSPVTTFNASSWTVYLPQLPASAQWVNHYSSKSYNGGQSIDVDVTNLDTFPLFKRSDAQYATSYVTQAN